MDWKRHIAVVAGLLTLSCLVQIVLIRRATVPALDAVRFVETARRIDTQGLLETFRREREQPLFPAWVWVVHEGFERTTGEFRSSWAASVQLAAAIPLVLAVVPVYLLSLRLVGPAPALAGSLLFCVLPEVSRLGADGISDGMHLLFFCLALWAVVVYLHRTTDGHERVQGSGFRVQDSGFRVQDSGSKVQEEARAGDSAGGRDAPIARLNAVEDSILGGCTRDSAAHPPLPCPAPPAGRNPLWLVAAGMVAALAVLVRAEALVLPAALVVTLLVFQFRAHRRQPWWRLAAAAGCLVLGCGLAFGPYLVAVGATTPRAAIGRILGRYEPDEEAEALRPASVIPATGVDVWQLDAGESMSFAPKEPTTSLRRRGYAAAAAQLAEELADAFGYLVGGFTLFGLWRLRRLLVRPVDRFLQGYCLLFSLAALHFAGKEGYVSARHLLTLVVVGIGCAGYGTLELGRWAAEFGVCSMQYAVGSRQYAAGSRQRAVATGRRRFSSLILSPVAWSAVLLAAGVCLLQAVEPLHVSRLGHRLAAEWLATEADAPGLVLDTRGLTGLYSGRTTYGYGDAQPVLTRPQLAYVVLERGELEYESRRSRTLKHLLEAAADPVARFPDPEGAEPRARAVVVYRWDAERFARWVQGRSEGHPRKEDRHARARLRVPAERIGGLPAARPDLRVRL